MLVPAEVCVEVAIEVFPEASVVLCVDVPVDFSLVGLAGDVVGLDGFGVVRPIDVTVVVPVEICVVVPVDVCTEVPVDVCEEVTTEVWPAVSVVVCVETPVEVCVLVKVEVCVEVPTGVVRVLVCVFVVNDGDEGDVGVTGVMIEVVGFVAVAVERPGSVADPVDVPLELRVEVPVAEVPPEVAPEVPPEVPPELPADVPVLDPQPLTPESTSGSLCVGVPRVDFR